MFCTKCGANIPDDSKVCPSCGEVLEMAAPAAPEKVEYGKFDAEEVSENKLMIVLMYFFTLIFFLLLVSDKRNDYIKFHMNNVLLILIVEVAAMVLCWTFIGPVVLGIFGVVIWVMGLITAFNGSKKPLPLVGKWNLVK